MKAKEKSVGSVIVGRLEAFQAALDRNEPIEKRFTCRTLTMPTQTAPLTPEAVKSIRQTLGASQSIFSRFLGVSQKTVQSWEQGVSRPSEMARRFLAEIRHNPKYWIDRLKQMTMDKSA